MYKALFKPNQLIYGNKHGLAVVSGWYPAKNLAKKLNEDDYGVIGQLYSPTRGINFLIRNLLYNPQITELILISCTKEDANSGSVQCLWDLFNKGYSKLDSGELKINSEVEGYLEVEIETGFRELFGRLVVCKIDNLQDACFAIRETLPDIGTGIRKEYPKNETGFTKQLPCNPIGHTIFGETIAETWLFVVKRIRLHGITRPTGYDGQWQELINLQAVVSNEPKGFYFPKPNFLPSNKEFVTSYLPQVIEDAPYIESVKYTYGQRLRSWFKVDQIEQVINKLNSEPDAASAVMSLWDVNDHVRGGSPCLNHIWLRVTDGKLIMSALFRSNDMFSAWVSNAMGLRALQEHIFDRLNIDNLQIGELITISQSAHIYDDCWENADKLINSETGFTKQKYNDAVGNFIIEVVKDGIRVEQQLKGVVVSEYFGKSALKLINDICDKNKSIEVEHIGYLGIELQKAETGFRTHTKYVQDK